MNIKTKSIVCGSIVALALLVAVSVPHIGQESTPTPHVRPMSAFVQADRVIPPPEPKPTLVGEETANVEPDSTPPTRIAFEPQKPNATTEILTTNEPSRGKPTLEPIPLKNTASVTATEAQMGDTRIVDGKASILPRLRLDRG